MDGVVDKCVYTQIFFEAAQNPSYFPVILFWKTLNWVIHVLKNIL